MATLTCEEVRTLFIDSENGWILDEQSRSGTATKVEIPVNEVMRHAILQGADSLLFAHNHPSGDPRPSKQDVEFTRKLVMIGKELKIRVFDHIIVSRNGSFSFRASGYM